jgi:serine/threonine-protein kinase
METAAREDAVLAEIGKYRLVAELARGGMGNIYLAALQGLGGFNKLLVVKELKPDLADDDTYVSMFLEEARLAARLIHPNIVQTNEVGSEGKRHFW